MSNSLESYEPLVELLRKVKADARQCGTTIENLRRKLIDGNALAEAEAKADRYHPDLPYPTWTVEREVAAIEEQWKEQLSKLEARSLRLDSQIKALQNAISKGDSEPNPLARALSALSGLVPSVLQEASLEEVTRLFTAMMERLPAVFKTQQRKEQWEWEVSQAAWELAKAAGSPEYGASAKNSTTTMDALYRAAVQRWHPDAHAGKQLPEYRRLQEIIDVLRAYHRRPASKDQDEQL